MQAHPGHPNGCRGAFVLPYLITIHIYALSEQVGELHGHFFPTTCSFLKLSSRQCHSVTITMPDRYESAL